MIFFVDFRIQIYKNAHGKFKINWEIVLPFNGTKYRKLCSTKKKSLIVFRRRNICDDAHPFFHVSVKKFVAWKHA